MINLYCIYDKIAEKAGPIFHADNDAVAIRGYNRLVNNGEIQPEDYNLMCVGEFNEKTMEIQHCLPYVVEVAVVAPKLPESVKKDLGRTCLNCVHGEEQSLVKNCVMCRVKDKIESNDNTCDDWRCK